MKSKIQDKVKKKDPIKALEIIRDWNHQCSDEFFVPLQHDWPEFYKLTKKIGGLFLANEEMINEVILEICKKNKKPKSKAR